MKYMCKNKSTKLGTKDVPMDRIEVGKNGKKMASSSLSKLGKDARKGLDIKPAKVR